jgi:uncharacterized protein (TIGR03118 family)
MLRINWLTTGLLFSAAALSAQTTTPANAYLEHGLVSDLPGIADHQDPNLVNPWGNGFSPTSPLWIGNNGSGTSTLYDGTGTAQGGTPPLVVTIPNAGGAGNAGPVTGVVFNAFSSNTSAFIVAGGKPASFIFCTEEGVIAGWNSSVSPKAAILFDNSPSGAVYKGCVQAGTAAAPLMFAANFNAGTVDVYDGGLHLNPAPYTKAFANPAIPAGFAPFNIQIMNGSVFVAYAKQNSQKHDDVAGPGNGYIAMFNQSGTLIANLISTGPLNSPWGMAIAPASFGAFGGALLVGNFGDGTINAFNLTTGAQSGALNDLTGKPIAIPGLWSLNFGNGGKNVDAGTLYFTAGIGGGPNNDPVESHGLFGSIQAAPFFQTSGIENGASLVAGPIAPDSFAVIKGNGLSATAGNWVFTGTTLPTSTNGVSVTVNGEAAPASSVSNTQIVFLVPADTQIGTAQIQVINNGLTSVTVPATVASLAPGFFAIGTVAATGHAYIAATHANFTDVAPVNFISTSIPSTPAEPGETIVLYGTGFGPTATGQEALPVNPTIVIDGIPASVTFAGLISPGLYQFNVVVPTSVTRGQDSLVVALLADSETQANAYISIAAQ